MVILMAAVCAWTPAVGQNPPTTQSEAQTARPGGLVAVVVISVAVLDKHGNPIEGLTRQSFHVKDDGIEQRLVSLNRDDVPISIGLVIDRSGSMADKSQFVNEAAIRFLQTSNPKDEFFLIGFNQHVELITDAATLNARLHDKSASGKTALLDAIYLGLSEMKNAHNDRKALIIFSDGGENSSRYKEKEVLEYAKESDVQINAFEIFDPQGRARTEEERDRPTTLSELCEASGGEIMVVQSLSSLSGQAARMSANLRAHCFIAYSPSRLGNDKKWHKIEVSVDVPRELRPARVIARSGYYSAVH
jgi:Ca-activated chloride channel family protein